MKKIIAALVFLALSFTASAGCYSEGVRVGVIQKFSAKGLVNKSWEGELVMDGMKIKSNSYGTKGGNVWKFSVLDPAVAKVIDDVTMTGGEVALRYCQDAVNLGLTSDTGYKVTQAVARK